uniref:Caspase activity and apoptosis inhibitor 1 n=2 Tax=Anser TaxID=8842 RepID=A0A8B9I8R3_9AVES
MAGRKSSKEKKRRRSRSCCPEGAAGPDGGERKRRSAESARGAPEVRWRCSAPWVCWEGLGRIAAALCPFSLLPRWERKGREKAGEDSWEEKCNVPSGEKVEEAEQPSDVEEGGLDLSVSLKPVSFYIADKKEMLQQCFCVIGEKKLQKMLPDILKNCSMDEIKRLCLEQLELLSEKKLLKILEGMNSALNCACVSRLLYDCYICVTGKGEDSDVLSINADAYDSDIEGPCNEDDGSDVQENTIRNGASQIDDLQKDIEKSVNEILGLAESSPKESKTASVAVPPSEGVQPSAQQLELLELEMRARAIKALMKAGDVKKQP